jgi:hypothetical protein
MKSRSRSLSEAGMPTVGGPDLGANGERAVLAQPSSSMAKASGKNRNR